MSFCTLSEPCVGIGSATSSFTWDQIRLESCSSIRNYLLILCLPSTLHCFSDCLHMTGLRCLSKASLCLASGIKGSCFPSRIYVFYGQKAGIFSKFSILGIKEKAHLRKVQCVKFGLITIFILVILSKNTSIKVYSQYNIRIYIEQ